MKTHRLQAAFARKRDAEHMRTERTAAVDRYYSHWDKVTTQFENWTGPEYYEQADANLRQTKAKKAKEISLQERRDKLRDLLAQEKITFDEQLANLRKPKSRNMSTDVMEKIDQNFKARKDEKRRLELEAKLYGRMRHGVDDESLLYESKSNNQVLAKLNWLDKQIEDQVLREEEEKIAQERTVRLQEEVRKTEEHHKERQEIRETEIREIRGLQEKHMQELKEREQEAGLLKSEAANLQSSLEHLSSELSAVDQRKTFGLQEAPLSHNLRNIKMTIRARSEVFRDQLKSDIELLMRINTICPDEAAISRLMDKMQHQRGIEMQNLAEIEGMYESEAKINLRQCEEAWRRLNHERYLDLTNLLKNLHSKLSERFYGNQMRQKELIDIRSTHLSSIETSNERLKLLIREHEESPRPIIIETPRSVQDQTYKSLHKVSDSFTNLNLDCLGGDEIRSQPNSARSQLDAIPDSGQRPKFGRKKVAWM